MASSAVYRYFASRDELLTALIVETYDTVGEAAERRAGAGPPSRRWMALASDPQLVVRPSARLLAGVRQPGARLPGAEATIAPAGGQPGGAADHA
jgi:AcrR family transcriptional regulator